ncbi:hypothetical protein FBEOM_1752 [Fusarium beomiforme]|uniref:Uncharacterized protein n=1 Tax=Fusarium beomiforme TaxID=44412 RepID=A0A9P5ASY3_9HYPO|nr:hypothetical protein FBEOM_1752 [Fusarium beomiforme]
MSLLARFTLVVFWALAVCAQDTVTVTDTVTYTVTETITSCSVPNMRFFYPRAEATVTATECAASCYSTVFECTSTQYTGTSSGITLPTGSSVILSESKSFTNVTSLPTVSIPSTTIFVNTSVSYTSIPETSVVISQPEVSIGSSALAGGTSSESESSLYGYSTSTFTQKLTTESVSNLETMPTFVPSADSSALAPGTTQFPQGEESTTLSQGTTGQLSESFPVGTESAPTEALSTKTYVSQPGNSTVPEGVSTTTIQSIITTQVPGIRNITTAYTSSTEAVTSEESTEAVITSSQTEGARTETGQSPASTEDVSSEVPVPSAESTAAGVSTTLTSEAELSTNTPCTSTKHTHIYDNTTIIHSTAQQNVDSSALAGSFTSASSWGTGHTSATSDVVEQTTVPGIETSEAQAGVSTSEYLESTSEAAAGVQITLPSDFIPIESTAAQADSAISTPSQPIGTPIPSTGSTGPQGYDFTNPSSNDGWPTASYASTADAATGFTTLVTTSKVTEKSSTSTGAKEPEYEPPAYEPPSYREPAYVRKPWVF